MACAFCCLGRWELGSEDMDHFIRSLGIKLLMLLLFSVVIRGCVYMYTNTAGIFFFFSLPF